MRNPYFGFAFIGKFHGFSNEKTNFSEGKSLFPFGKWGFGVQKIFQEKSKFMLLRYEINYI
jgi:hypothetical protein